MRKVWEWLKALPGKVWDALVNWLNSIRRDRLYHFICGIIIAAFACITLHMGVWCFVPVLFAGFIKEFIDQWGRQAFDWVDLAATIVGGTEEAIASEPSTAFRADIGYGIGAVKTILDLKARVEASEGK